MVDDVTRDGYAARDLVGLAGDLGFARISERFIDEWVAAGLLPPATRHGLGRGGGSSATWSERHKDLFVTLMKQRAQGARPAALTNIPVFTWLMYGDEWVGMGQVRRCLKTWSSRARGTGEGAAAKVARAALEEIAHPAAKPRDVRALATAVAAIAYTSDLDLDPDLVRLVFDPTSSQINSVAGEAWVDLISGRLAVLRWLDQGGPDDVALQQARVAYRSMRSTFRPGSSELNEAVNSACNMLVVLLALELKRENSESGN